LMGAGTIACTEPATRTRLKATIDADHPIRAQIVDVEARIEVRTTERLGGSSHRCICSRSQPTIGRSNSAASL
jgi:hypothetical protein